MKTCTKCLVKKELSQFNKRKSSKDGLNCLCRECANRQKRNWVLRNKHHVKEYAKKYREENPEKLKAYKQKEDYKQRQDEYRKVNRDRLNKRQRAYEKTKAGKEKNKRYRLNNLDKFAYRESVRRANKANATPEWSELDKIKVLYEKCKWLESLTGFKYHVDHIIPLQSDAVCGLHVWANLQILQDQINQKKNNKILTNEGISVNIKNGDIKERYNE